MHLYLHIPFCHEICPYCSFYKHKPGSVSQGLFIQALLTELKWHSERIDLAQISTIYFGGGTPSLLSPKHFESLLEGVRAIVPFETVSELTLEANPSTFDQKKARLFKDLGITRVSLGVQSFDEKQLKVLGRDHTAQSAEDSYYLLREAELPSLNLDFMFSTPGQTLTSWRSTLEKAVSLEPDHLSAYNLTYELDTDYFEKFLAGEYLDDPELNETLFTFADTFLESAGYRHYETSNYAKEGHESQHNKGYWKGGDYLGIGPSAVSCIQRVRHKNIPDTSLYIKQVSTMGHSLQESETLNEEAWRLERLALELRTVDGCDLSYCDPDLTTTLIEHKLVESVGGRIRTTKQGGCLVDSIVEYLA